MMELVLSREPNDVAWELYENSFPYCERRGRDRHNEVLKDTRFLPYHIIENNKLVGLLYCWQWDDFVFGEHLATLPEVRGGGIGAKAIGKLLEIVGEKTFIIEIEPPVTEIAARRENFYKRLGFVTNQYNHIHPSYREPKEPHKLLVMSYQNLISKDVFDRFQKENFAIL